jgi:potassium-dependent mechanosensitive channel
VKQQGSKPAMKAKQKRRSRLSGLLASLIGWCFIFSWSFGSTWLQSAEPAKNSTPSGESSAVPPAPVAILNSEIIPRSDQTVKSLQQLRLDVAADPTLRSIQRDFATFAEKSDRRRQSEAGAARKSRSVPRLNEILRQWSLEQSKLEAWDQALTRRSHILAAEGQDVDRTIETWRATQAAVAKKFEFKAILQGRVEEVLREAQATREVLQEQRIKLLELQSQVADELLSLANSRKEIDQAREEFSRRLFYLDSPPLWEALFRPEAQTVIGAEVAERAAKFVDDVKEFLQEYSHRILWHVLFFLALVALFHVLRRGLIPEPVERLGGTSAQFILNRPIAASLLLALIVLPLLYPAAVAAILRIATLPTIIPIVLLLPGFLPKIFLPWAYMLLGLYALDFLRYLLLADWLSTRVLLMITATLGCIGLGLFLRSSKAELSASSSRERLIVLVVKLVLFLFAVSVISNVVGNMTLAEILVGTAVRISYFAALIATSSHLLVTLAVAAMQLPALRSLRSVRAHGELIASRCGTVIRFVAIVLWVLLSLYVVGVLGDIWTAGETLLQLRWKLGETEISVGGLATFLSVLVSAILVARLFRFILTEEIFPRIALPRGVPGAVDVLSRYGVLLLGFFIALAAAGVDLTKVTLLIGALGVGIGFGLQNVVNNFVSGLILIFEHPIQVGDVVEVGTSFGEIRKIGFRASVLRTPDGADVIVPNSELVGSRVINWSLFDRLRRINISVGTAYGTDPNRVIDILIGIARKHPAVLANPAPQAVFDRFAESSLNFTLLCWTDVDSFFLARSELTIAINEEFKGAGIQIPFPQQEVFVHWPGEAGAAAAQPSEPASEIIQGRSPERALFLSGKGSVAKK